MATANPLRETDVAIVIVNYRTPELTKRCLAALRDERKLPPKLRVIVADGGSGDGSADNLARAIDTADYSPWVSFLPLPINGGFGWANNQAMAKLLQHPPVPDFIHLLNPDTVIENGAVRVLAEYLQTHPGVAAVGSQLLEPDGSLTGSAFSFPTVRGEFSRGARTSIIDKLLNAPPDTIWAHEAREVDWATGASVMFRTEALRQVGLFDEGFFLYHEEIELMWRLRNAGWTIAFEPRSRVRHVGGGATGVHSRATAGRLEPRKPSYWYRSRTRFFALTRGRATAALAYFAWLAGHMIWRVRKLAGLARTAKPFDHQFRDHVTCAFPRRGDAIAARRDPESRPTAKPAWMEKGW